MSFDVGAEAQRAAEERLVAITEAEEALDENPEAEVDYPACAPFCGCETCVVREVLDAAWPVIIGGMAAFLARNNHGAAGRLLLGEFRT